VAVKMVRAELAEQADFGDRFAREVAAAHRVSGLFTAPVVDADLDGPVPWLATACVAVEQVLDLALQDVEDLVEILVPVRAWKPPPGGSSVSPRMGRSRRSPGLCGTRGVRRVSRCGLDRPAWDG